MAGEARGTPRQRALAFLISSHWLTGEAALLGAPVSEASAERVLGERKATEGGEDEESTADMRLEIRTELAAAAIRRRLRQRIDDLSSAEIEGYYRSHPGPFRRHELRNVDLIGNLASPAAARSLVTRIGTGSAFSRIADHQALAHNADAHQGTPTKEVLLKAIFAAHPGVVSPPVKVRGRWAVFVVRSISPAAVKPLSEVRAQVRELLAAQREQQLTAALRREYAARWRARTSCSPGYVVQGCFQYRGPVTPGEAPF